MNKLKADITLGREHDRGRSVFVTHGFSPWGLEDPPESEKKIEICEKGSKRIIFGNDTIWKEVVVFVRSSMGGGGVGGGAFYFCLIDYNEHIPKQEEITGVSNSFLFSI